MRICRACTPGPYMSRMCCGSRLTSNASAASVCMRKPSSNDWMRASSAASSLPRFAGADALSRSSKIELLALLRRRHAVVADVLDELLDGRVLRVDVRAFVDARQKAGLPVLRFLNRIARSGTSRQTPAGSGSPCPGRSTARTPGWAESAGRRRSSSAAATARGSARRRASSGSRRCRRSIGRRLETGRSLRCRSGRTCGT